VATLCIGGGDLIKEGNPGLERKMSGRTQISEGIISTAFLKDPTDPQWKEDPAYKEWVAFMDKYYPNGDQTTTFTEKNALLGSSAILVPRQTFDRNEPGAAESTVTEQGPIQGLEFIGRMTGCDAGQRRSPL
jgi:hypothetical protein